MSDELNPPNQDVLHSQRLAISLIRATDNEMGDEILDAMTKTELKDLVACLAGFSGSAWVALTEYIPQWDTLQDAMDTVAEQVEKFEGRYPKWGQ